MITGLGHGAGGLSLRREGLGTAIEKRFIGEREIEVGDPAFDDEYYVQGQPALALAILEPETRRRLAVLLRGHVAIEGRAPVDVNATLADGVLEVRVKESGFSGRGSTSPRSSQERSTWRASSSPRRTWPHASQRTCAARRSLERGCGPWLTLAREFGGHPATRATLLAALGDTSEEVRLRAAMALGEEGRETLLDLVGRKGTDDACAARAIEALGEQLPLELGEATLRGALGEAGRPRTALACLEALGRQGRASAEGLMIEALRSRDSEVQAAAARALGRAGTVAAVPALHEATPPHGDLLRSVGRQSIAEIQARLAGAEPGQLTLASGQAGALSLADGEPGRLSLSADPEESAVSAPAPADSSSHAERPGSSE